MHAQAMNAGRPGPCPRPKPSMKPSMMSAMTFPALAPQAQARAWKAQRGRRTPSREEARRGRPAQRTELDFGVPFLFYAVAARQGLVGLVDGLGLGPRDAVRAMSLFYAQESCPSALECDQWLEKSVAQLLFPASGLLGVRRQSSAGPKLGDVVRRLLENAGAPGMLPRFLKAFKARTDEIYHLGGEVVFIDSNAMDAEDSGGLPPNPFLPQPVRSRWLFAVRRGGANPVGLAEVRVPGSDQADPAAGPEHGWIDQGGLAQAFGVFDEAGIEAASCLLGGCMLHDPLLDRFYDAEGRLAHSYVAIVLAVDPQLMEMAKGVAGEELLAPGRRLSLPDAALFTATRKVRAGKGARPAWLHIGYCFLPPEEDEEDEDMQAQQAGAQQGTQEAALDAGLLEALDEVLDADRKAGGGSAILRGGKAQTSGWHFLWRFAIVTGQEMTGAEAFKEYYSLQKSARVCGQAPCRLREPTGSSPARRRGHELFCAIGLAAWGLMAECMEMCTQDLPSLLAGVSRRMPCRLRPGRVNLGVWWKEEDPSDAFMAAGVFCPRTIFLDGPRLRYDPLRDFVQNAEWINADEELLEYLAQLTPESMEAPLSDRPAWPRLRRLKGPCRSPRHAPCRKALPARPGKA
ncbi:MAG: hypothetical protein J5863_07710 [Desulfovibrio sp.]|nr:hypothetical protein [Desulfovibrio sp.]